MRLSPVINRHRIGVAGLLAAILAIGLLGPIEALFRRAAAQPGPNIILRGNGRLGFAAARADGENSDVGEGVFLPIDRDTTRQWEKAKQLISQGYYSDGVVLLDEILARDEDFFFKSSGTLSDDSSESDDTGKASPARSAKVTRNASDPEAVQPVPTRARSTVNRDARDKATMRSLKLEAERLIGNLPPDGLQAYELQFGARARRMLGDAIKSPDIGQLEQVARRFFHTKAGYEATLLLGRQHLDRGRPLVAAMCLQRLLNSPAAAAEYDPELSALAALCWWRAGMSDRAVEILVGLKKRDPKATIHIADHSARLFNEDQKAKEWLVSQFDKPPEATAEQKENWALYRGSPSRNASVRGGIPLLNPRWRVSTTTHPSVEKALVNLRQQYIDQGLAMLPAIHPLAVGSLVLMPTGKDLLAIDLNSGKRLWPVRSGNETSVDQWLQVSNGSGQPRSDLQASPLLAERFLLDVTRGTLASDGRQVYLISEADRSVPQPIPVQGGFGRRRMMMQAADSQPRTNKLCACELRTEGKLKWEVGGESGGEEPKLARAFFLGAPLPLQDRLYVLVETKGEIKLCVLDSATGHLEWSQQLAVVETNLQNDIFRRLAGCTPSFADGVLVCPTCAGAVVAVDIANRTLLWGYLYQRNHPMLGMYRNVAPMIGFGGENFGNQTERWTDATITLAEGCALITAPECNELHCVSLTDGKSMWSKPIERGDNLYVGGVHKGNAILVGKHAVSALRLSDGKPVWKSKSADLKDVMPSGRG